MLLIASIETKGTKTFTWKTHLIIKTVASEISGGGGGGGGRYNGPLLKFVLSPGGTNIP